MEAPTIPEVLHLTLKSKEHCPIAYTFTQLTKQTTETTSDVLLVYVNGLGLPQTFWQPSIQLLKDKLAAKTSTKGRRIYAATYDRYGQSLSQPDAEHPVQSHSIEDSVDDLHAFISEIRTIHPLTASTLKVVLVAHSIGVPLSRLYIQAHPNTISAALFLDSNIANTDFVSLIPDPNSASFDPSTLPADTTVDQLIWTRSNYERMFHPAAPNPEKLDRSNIPSLLPHADQPHLSGVNGDDLILGIVAHDPQAFAEESLKISTRGLTDEYVEPAWKQYNTGLCGLSSKTRGIVTASGSGHFVQRDNPDCVAEEVVSLLGRLI